MPNTTNTRITICATIFATIFAVTVFMSVFLVSIFATAQETESTDEETTPGETIFPYQLTKTKDIPLSIASAGVFTGGMIAAYSVDPVAAPDVASLDAADVNALDRPATRRWSPASNTASNITVTAGALLPLALSIPQFSNRKIRAGLTLWLMYAQSMGLTIGLTGMVKAIAQRRRPFLYNESLSLEEKLDQSGTQKSFYSQHTAMAFCSGVFLAKAFADIYPQSKWKAVIWPTSLLLASTTGLLRFTAGKHFPTDILTGALVGSLMGYIVPVIHTRKSTVEISLIPKMGDIRGLDALILF